MRFGRGRGFTYENMGTMDGFHVVYNTEDETYTIVDEQGSDIDITVGYDEIHRLGLLMLSLDDDATRRALS